MVREGYVILYTLKGEFLNTRLCEYQFYGNSQIYNEEEGFRKPFECYMHCIVNSIEVYSRNFPRPSLYI